MPRPIRDLWKSLGASESGDGDALQVSASALSLPSVFGGQLSGSLHVKLFSEEAFGFVAPEELAALGVFWAPHLERPEQLRAAIKDTQDRLKRRLEDDIEALVRLGFEGGLKAPHARAQGAADIGGHQLEVALGPNGELLLVAIDDEAVPELEQELFRELEGVARADVVDRAAERSHHLVEAGIVVPRPGEGALGDDEAGGFEDNETKQLPSARADDPGTEMVPPPSDEGDLSSLEQKEIVSALAEDDLLDDSDESGESTAPKQRALRSVHDTVPPDSGALSPILPTQQQPPSAEGASLVPSLGSFDEDTGEQELVVSLSGEDGVMPSPAEATALRPAPSASELGLAEAGQDALAAGSTGIIPDEEQTLALDDENTVARAPPFRKSTKGPSLVSSGNASRSAEHRDDEGSEPSQDAPDVEDLDALAASALNDEAKPLAAAQADEDEDDEEHASTLKPGGMRREGMPISDQEADASAELAADAAERPEPAAAPAARQEETKVRSADQERRSLEVEVDVDLDLDESFTRTRDGLRAPLSASASQASLVDDVPEEEERTLAGVPSGAMSEDRFDALAAIVGEGISSGKTGAIMLDADAFAQLRGETSAEQATDDPEALEREAELLEARARELRAKAELLRARPTVKVAKRRLAERLEKQREGRADEADSEVASVVVDDDAPAVSGEGDDAFAPAGAAQERSRAGAAEVSGEGDDAFADGVALAEVRAMLELEADASSEGYAATQVAELDLGDLRQPSVSGGDVFGDAGEDDDDEGPTGRARAMRSSMESLPQLASADVHALGSLADLSGEGPTKQLPVVALDDDDDDDARTLGVAAAEPARGADAARALALVVSDPRARERLKKHLEESFPRVIELASTEEAASLSSTDIQAVVIVRPQHDEVTVSGLKMLEGNDGRPPVLVLSSDASFDGLPGVDLRLSLGRRASEVARQVLEGLSTLGV